MKNNKVYTLLIIMAFLSFSCSEDEKSDDKQIDDKTGASKYLFNENSIYTYSIESQNDDEFDSYNADVLTGDFYVYGGKNSIQYYAEVGEERYMSAEGDVLFGYGTFLEIDHLEKDSWLPIVDLSKNEWTLYSETITSELVNETVINELKGKYVKEISYSFNNKNYKGIELIYSSYGSYGYFQNNKYVPIQYEEGTETIWLVEGLGLVKDNSSKFHYENEFESYTSTVDVNLIQIKEK